MIPLQNKLTPQEKAKHLIERCKIICKSDDDALIMAQFVVNELVQYSIDIDETLFDQHQLSHLLSKNTYWNDVFYELIKDSNIFNPAE